MELCPDISIVTIERTFADLVKNEYIAKVGAGPFTAYVRILKMDTAILLFLDGGIAVSIYPIQLGNNKSIN